MEFIMNTIEWIKTIVSQNFSAITGLGGVYIGAWLTQRQNKEQRKLEFCEKQLRELYSPLFALRKEIRILSEFRLAGEVAQDQWWQEVCQRSRRIKDDPSHNKFIDKEREKITGQIEYNNKQLTEKIIPAYRQMVNIWKENYWLSEEDTKEYFPTLIKFVETWERHLSRTHAPEVLEEISVSEDKLMPFYDHIEKFHNTLRKKLMK